MRSEHSTTSIWKIVLKNLSNFSQMASESDDTIVTSFDGRMFLYFSCVFTDRTFEVGPNICEIPHNFSSELISLCLLTDNLLYGAYFALVINEIDIE